MLVNLPLLGGMSKLELTAIQFITFIFYSLTVHPLAKFPGPLLAKITNLYAVYHAYVGDVHLDMLRCHELYGEITRRLTLVLSTQETLQGVKLTRYFNDR